MASKKAKSAPKSKVEKVVEEDKVQEVIEKLKAVRPEKFKVEKVTPQEKEDSYKEVAEKIVNKRESTTEDDIMEIKAYLTEACEMLVTLSKKLEKASKSGNRFLTAASQIERLNRYKIIV